MDVTTLSKTWLEEIDRIRKIYESDYDVSHDKEVMLKAYAEDQIYPYAGMSFTVACDDKDQLVLGQWLH